MSDSKLNDAVFLRACRRQPTPYTPIWIMRQAGRYMKEYRAVREKVGFLELCKRPDLACEVTVVAAEKLGVDAAIIFADILLITEPLGFDLTFTEKIGPRISNPFRSADNLEQLQEPNVADSLSFVYEAIRQTRAALPANIPLIGFAGAPFTVASYVIEGRGSKTLENTKALMRSDPDAWHQLLKQISSATADYLLAQIDAGAQVIQLFDSWIGHVSPQEYDEYVSPHVRSIFDRLPQDIPKIHFGTNTDPLLEKMKAAGGTVIGVDFKTSLANAWDRLGDVAIQGNLDPDVLLTTPKEIETGARAVLDQAAGRNGHIFNLGHGILPTTPFDHAKHLVDFVHERSSR